MKLPGFFTKTMKYQKDVGYVLPSSIAASIVFFIIIIDAVLGNYSEEKKRVIVISISIGGSLYVILQTLLVAPRIQEYRTLYIWVNAVVSGLGLSLMAAVLDETHHAFIDILLILAVTSIAIISGRGPTYLLIAVSEVGYILAHQGNIAGFTNWVIHLIPVAVVVVITETILRLRRATQNQIRRLEMLNTFSQQINSSLETGQVLSILNAALQKAINADSYYVGLVEHDVIQLDLFYDDGEYFSDIQVPLNDTLAGWVIQNQTPLFLPDLREGTQITDLQATTFGKNRTSMSWIGVPMKTAHVNGLLAVSSYNVNAFTPTDMELISNLAQHAALAIDNTVHHQKVEEQSRLDSLTSTYNHRYFLQALQEHIDQVISGKQVISLIMLDIDFFKKYNDTYGHQIGDEILVKLCKTIQKYTKKTDFIGRWGGEEFAIALPGARGDEAYLVAERVQKSMQNMTLVDPKQVKIPAPTVSQGISVFPDEAVDINHFVYLADQRLYVAKERGRNQIEPDISHWKKVQSSKRKSGASS